MNIEGQLREYRTMLDAATEETAAAKNHEHVPVPIRVRPARALIVAAVAVAAAVAIAFAIAGTTGKRSTPPAGVTTTPAPATTPAPSTTSSLPRRAGSPLTVPVTVCPTQQGTTSPNDPHAPSTITISTPGFTTPTVAGYSGTRGFLVATAPAGWNCRALEAGDGGQAIGVTPPGATPRDSWGNPGNVTKPLTDGLFATSVPACQGCVYDEICGVVPTAATDFPGFSSLPCTRPAGEVVTDRGYGVWEFEDPAGAIGPDAARSLLRYTRATAHTDASVVRVTCILPAAQSSEVCSALFAEFFALQPTPWSGSSLTISPTALGAVEVGMGLTEAQNAAGQTFDGAGDGFVYSTQQMKTGLHLYAGLGGNSVACVGAEIVKAPQGPVQRVVTPEGFALGDSVAQLLAIYGTRATFVPAPPSGMTTNAGYVVKEKGGALAFAVHQSKVFEIAGGAADLTPNSCTG